MKNAPWRERLQVLRAVRKEAAESDGYFARALMAEADVLRAAGHASAAAAAEAFASSAGPEHEPDRLGHALSAARTLAGEFDRPGARALLTEILDHGGAATPSITGPALELAGRLSADDRDVVALDTLLARARADVPERPDVRLALLDLAGVLALDRGDVPAAERRLTEARRIFADAHRAGGTLDKLASEAWLEMTLPKRVDAK